MLFDSHVHLNDPQYENYEEIIKIALANGVEKMVVVGYDLESSRRAVEIANKYSFIYAAIGLHPSEANRYNNQDLKMIEELISSKVVAIGEIGLDYHYDDADKDKQKELFVKQIEIAKKYDLPIIIHSRDACNDTYNILKNNQDLNKKGIVHCYAYSLEMSKEFIKLGYVLGIGGVVTFKNAKEIKEVVAQTTITNLVLETDAPYLAPTPFRGKINEPQYLKYIASEVASIKGETEEIIGKVTCETTKKVFGIQDED